MSDRACLRAVGDVEARDIATTVEAARRGDATAFAALVEAHRAGVRAVAYAHTGDANLSDEIVQETFVVAWHRLAAIGDPSRIGGWLRGVARRLARRRSKRRTHEPLVTDVVDDRVGDPIAKLEARELLMRTLMRMPAAYREPLILFHATGEPTRRIAEILGITVDAAEQRLRRGRAALAKEVERLLGDELSERGGRRSSKEIAGVAMVMPLGEIDGGNGWWSGAGVMAMASGKKILGGRGAGIGGRRCGGDDRCDERGADRSRSRGGLGAAQAVAAIGVVHGGGTARTRTRGRCAASTGAAGTPAHDLQSARPRGVPARRANHHQSGRWWLADRRLPLRGWFERRVAHRRSRRSRASAREVPAAAVAIAARPRARRRRQRSSRRIRRRRRRALRPRRCAGAPCRGRRGDPSRPGRRIRTRGGRAHRRGRVHRRLHVAAIGAGTGSNGHAHRLVRDEPERSHRPRQRRVRWTHRAVRTAAHRHGIHRARDRW
ncbi:MAG: RNA polymerase sigma factor [Deltaproteobacteria bacterium]|nr:RNA polymerase sigma factor [Deltaproteobacteria bacterium]